MTIDHTVQQKRHVRDVMVERCAAHCAERVRSHCHNIYYPHLVQTPCLRICRQFVLLCAITHCYLDYEVCNLD